VEGNERLAFIATLWLAFALRVWRLGDKAIWWDEGRAHQAQPLRLAHPTGKDCRDDRSRATLRRLCS
jgi:hypothetical protein